MVIIRMFIKQMTAYEMLRRLVGSRMCIGDRGNYERRDRNTIAHQGSYLMPLLIHFSDLDITDRMMAEKGDDLVYFPMPLVKMLSFPFSWLAAMIIISAASYTHLTLPTNRKQ